MKTILFDKSTDNKKNFKRICLSQTVEEAEYISTVKKSFAYTVSLSDDLSSDVPKPDVFITKEFDALRKREYFCFRVKGYFYTVYKRVVIKVQFEHILRIEILWKKNFSPKKSVVLTE